MPRLISLPTMPKLRTSYIYDRLLACPVTSSTYWQFLSVSFDRADKNAVMSAEVHIFHPDIRPYYRGLQCEPIKTRQATGSPLFKRLDRELGDFPDHTPSPQPSTKPPLHHPHPPPSPPIPSPQPAPKTPSCPSRPSAHRHYTPASPTQT